MLVFSIHQSIPVRKYTYIIFAVCLLALAACGPDGSKFRLSGSFRDMQEGELYIYNVDDDEARFDTIAVKDGRFLYKGQAKAVTPYMLVFPNGVEQVVFVGPGADLTYEATANDLKNYVVNGSDENKLMNEFRKETYQMDAPRTTSAARKFISEHPETHAALYLLDRYFIQEENVSNEELAKLLKIVKAGHEDDRYLRYVEHKVKQMEKSGVGKVVPEIALRSQKDKTVNLWKDRTRSDYNLIAFWAVWSIDGYDMLWKLREYAGKYKDEGRLRIVAISLDVERYRWEDAVRQDSIRNIEHYCDGMAFESGTVKALGVETVPSYVITDKKHKILEKGTDMNSLTKALDKYLGSSEKKSLNVDRIAKPEMIDVKNTATIK